MSGGCAEIDVSLRFQCYLLLPRDILSTTFEDGVPYSLSFRIHDDVAIALFESLLSGSEFVNSTRKTFNISKRRSTTRAGLSSNFATESVLRITPIGSSGMTVGRRRASSSNMGLFPSSFFSGIFDTFLEPVPWRRRRLLSCSNMLNSFR